MEIVNSYYSTIYSFDFSKSFTVNCLNAEYKMNYNFINMNLYWLVTDLSIQLIKNNVCQFRIYNREFSQYEVFYSTGQPFYTTENIVFDILKTAQYTQDFDSLVNSNNIL